MQLQYGRRGRAVQPATTASPIHHPARATHSPTPSRGLGLSMGGRVTGRRTGSCATTYRDLVTGRSSPSARSRSCGGAVWVGGMG